MILQNQQMENKKINNTLNMEKLNTEIPKEIYKLKLNITLHDNDKNKFIFIVNLLLLERACSQRIVFIKDKTNFSKTLPLKIGCVVTLRRSVLINFMKMFVYYSLPKINQCIIDNNKQSMQQELVSLHFDKFLFVAMFSYYLDFDKFLIYYENINYEFYFQIYTACHKFIYNRLIYSENGLKTY